MRSTLCCGSMGGRKGQGPARSSSHMREKAATWVGGGCVGVRGGVGGGQVGGRAGCAPHFSGGRHCPARVCQARPGDREAPWLP